jgi:hypothetical protein
MESRPDQHSDHPAQEQAALLIALPEPVQLMGKPALRMQSSVEPKGLRAPLRPTSVLGRLWVAHERALAAVSIDECDEGGAVRVEEVLRQFPRREWEALWEHAVESYDAAVPVVEDLAISLLTLLAKLETVPQEDIDAMTPEQSAMYLSALAPLRDNREFFLAELSVAERDEWEHRRLTSPSS